MLKAIVVATEEESSKELACKLNDYFAGSVIFQALPLSREVTGDIRRKGADLLVTMDLAGFDRTTFTDGIAYNLLDCKQVHLLLQEKPENEACLERPLSIAMFFGCRSQSYAEYLRGRYPGIPWLKVLWDEKGEQEMPEGELSSP